MPLPSLGGTLGFGDTSVTEAEPYCEHCKKYFANRELYNSHLPGSTHRMNIAALHTGKLFGTGKMFAHIDKLLEPVQLREVEDSQA